VIAPVVAALSPRERDSFSIIGHDEANHWERPLDRRKGWKQLQCICRKGDTLQARLADLGPIWRKRFDVGLGDVLRRGATLVIILPEGERLKLRAPVSKAALEPVRDAVFDARREYIGSRASAGMLKALAEGKRIGRWIPLGWEQGECGRLVKSERELELVRWICQQHEAGRTYASIAVELAERREYDKHDRPWNEGRILTIYLRAIELGIAKPRSNRPWHVKRMRETATNSRAY
jgi:hypothetical protein